MCIILGNTFVITNCRDDVDYNTYYVAVRAINVDNNDTFMGDWSPELQSYCEEKPSMFGLYKFIIITVVALLLLLTFLYVGRRYYLNYYFI